ncbi:hypothetical protein COCOBI_13-2850 [Coccomyxa sp. Obi]|nr:hypothetical protein COCOBI_13-2850 [Coccomyxa sp. Obi]
MMARTQPNPSESPDSLLNADKEESIEEPLFDYMMAAAYKEYSSKVTAGQEQLPVPPTSPPQDHKSLVEGMTNVRNDPPSCKVVDDGAALPDHEIDTEEPLFDYRMAAAYKGYNSKVLNATLGLFGVPDEMDPGAAELTEAPVTVTGAFGMTYTYLPSDLEEARNMSFDEVVAGLKTLREETRKYNEFNLKVGNRLADYLQKYGRPTMESS